MSAGAATAPTPTFEEVQGCLDKYREQDQLAEDWYQHPTLVNATRKFEDSHRMFPICLGKMTESRLMYFKLYRFYLDNDQFFLKDPVLVGKDEFLNGAKNPDLEVTTAYRSLYPRDGTNASLLELVEDLERTKLQNAHAAKKRIEKKRAAKETSVDTLVLPEGVVKVYVQRRDGTRADVRYIATTPKMQALFKAHTKRKCSYCSSWPQVQDAMRRA